MDDLGSRLNQLRSLTAREREVLGLVCQGGRTYEEIGRALFISERTILFHMGNVYEKLGLAELSKADRARELGRFCPVLGYLSEEDPEPPAAAGSEPEPEEPRALALTAVREDAPISRREVAMERWTPGPIEPGWVDETKHNLPRRIIPVLIVGMLGIAVGAWAVNAVRPPQPAPGDPRQTATPMVGVGGGTSTAVTPSVPGTAVPVTPSATLTPRPGSPTPTPSPTMTPTATPLPPTPIDSILRFGETWIGQGMYLTAKGVPREAYLGGPLVADFTLENRTSLPPLDFDMITNTIYIEFSDGRRFPAQNNKVTVNGFANGNRRDFTATWNLSWSDFQAIKRDPKIEHYVVGADGLLSRVSHARWREAVLH